jgi:RNA ligase (TIGR02306 family)
MRKLATIRIINEILPIEGADLIVTAVIDGWTVVVKKDEFRVNDPCFYFEIDSFLPDGNPAWQHLVEKHPRTFDGKRGHRLRTVRLRGQLSQGFAAPVNALPEFAIECAKVPDEYPASAMFTHLYNLDWSDILGIVKYEPPVPAELAGQVRGNFPGFIPKTDQERCQNLGTEIFVTNVDSRYEVSMKLDGTSFTSYYRDGDDGVCGRNWELKTDGSNDSNTLVRMYVDSGLQTALRELRLNYAVQGELMGPGIQKNREGLTAHKLFVFDVYNIDEGKYLSPSERHDVMVELWNRGLNRDIVQHVPVMTMDVTLTELGINNTNELLAFAEGPSLNHPIREGLVFKRVDGGFSFKAISNAFLLKEKD